VATHLVSPWSKGLFKKAVIESGPIGLPFNQYGQKNKVSARCTTSTILTPISPLFPSIIARI